MFFVKIVTIINVNILFKFNLEITNELNFNCKIIKITYSGGKNYKTAWKYEIIKKQKIKHLWNFIHIYIICYKERKEKINSWISRLTKCE